MKQQCSSMKHDIKEERNTKSFSVQDSVIHACKRECCESYRKRVLANIFCLTSKHFLKKIRIENFVAKFSLLTFQYLN